MENQTENTRVAVISILLESSDAAEKVNALLHEYGVYIIGRMGLPYPAKKIHIISVALDAPQDEINALSGKLGRLSVVSAKTAYQNL